MAATGNNIRRLRRAAQLSVRQMQEIFGFTTPQAIYKWERGDALPTLDNMTVLSRTLGVQIEEIIVYQSTGKEES
ncbi:MAG: helix-turn-helix transcriptional regulator [Oscillospiraceae bacterium]|nr:helix-turn-helix transcriptional regulator [Oscillospiraceae bacterium]